MKQRHQPGCCAPAKKDKRLGLPVKDSAAAGAAAGTKAPPFATSMDSPVPRAQGCAVAISGKPPNESRAYGRVFKEEWSSGMISIPFSSSTGHTATGLRRRLMLARSGVRRDGPKHRTLSSCRPMFIEFLSDFDPVIDPSSHCSRRRETMNDVRVLLISRGWVFLFFGSMK